MNFATFLLLACFTVCSVHSASMKLQTPPYIQALEDNPISQTTQTFGKITNNILRTHNITRFAFPEGFITVSLTFPKVFYFFFTSTLLLKHFCLVEQRLKSK